MKEMRGMAKTATKDAPVHEVGVGWLTGHEGLDQPKYNEVETPWGVMRKRMHCNQLAPIYVICSSEATHNGRCYDRKLDGHGAGSKGKYIFSPGAIVAVTCEIDQLYFTFKAKKNPMLWRVFTNHDEAMAAVGAKFAVPSDIRKEELFSWPLSELKGRYEKVTGVKAPFDTTKPALVKMILEAEGEKPTW
jgi:hypothetical protein